MTCSVKGCDAEATLQPEPWLWARGYSKDTHSPVKMHMDLPCCAGCAADTTMDDLFHEKGKRKIENAFKMLNRALPDWDTAELHWSKIERRH